MSTTRQPDPEDIFVWPDHAYCHRYELEEFSQGKSDDYEVLYWGTPQYEAFINAADADALDLY